MTEVSTSASDKPLGFWSCWGLAVGTVVGSGIFMLPAVLAPYGMLGIGGVLIAGAGAMALALSFARLAGRTAKNGGPYVYVRGAFGDLMGFLTGWAIWASFWIATPVVAIAFVGYLAVFIPALADNSVAQALTACGLIWTLTLVNIRGVREASVVQLAMTILKIVPLVAIMGLAFAIGTPANLPPVNPQGAPVLTVLAATALLALWPFTGFEAVTMPAGNVRDCQRNIPRALATGMSSVIVIYLGAMIAAMLLVPNATLATSTAPFADAARGFGAWGVPLVAAGALIATAGTLNGIIFTCGQLPMAIAADGLAPARLATTTRGGGPYVALLLSATLGSLLLLTNYSRGLIGAYTFLVMMSTATTLLPYLFTALAELWQSWRSAPAWGAVALLACVYSLFALLGSGLEVLAWGWALTAVGVPVYFLARQRRTTPAARASPS